MVNYLEITGMVCRQGMERILFPKNYEDYIEQYTTKVGLDPDFVYAIIRQESVFNPRAKSSVGSFWSYAADASDRKNGG